MTLQREVKRPNTYHGSVILRFTPFYRDFSFKITYRNLFLALPYKNDNWSQGNLIFLSREPCGSLPPRIFHLKDTITWFPMKTLTTHTYADNSPEPLRWWIKEKGQTYNIQYTSRRDVVNILYRRHTYRRETVHLPATASHRLRERLMDLPLRILASAGG